MKIFIFNRKLLISIFITILIILLAFFYFYHPISFAVELSSSSILNEKLKESNNTTEKIAYLTFDDGPTKKATSKILDILKEENISATFFVVGKHVKELPELVKRAHDEGHYIANHGYSHNNSKLYKSEDSFIKEIKDTDAEIGNAIGIENYCSHVFRFPNGYMSSNYKFQKQKCAKLLKDLNYVYVDWNCLNKDSERKYTKTQLLNNLKKSCKNKNNIIVLMHDTNDVNNTTAVLKDSINYLKEQGYSFKNFGQWFRVVNGSGFD